MARLYSVSEVVALVEALDEPRLTRWVGARIVAPAQSDHGPVFAEADVARLRLAVDLSDDFDLPEDALDMVLGLVDQLATLRGDMRALMQAVAAEPDEVRTRIQTVIRRAR